MTGAVIPAGREKPLEGPDRLAERVMLGVCVDRGWVFSRSTELQIVEMMLAFARSSACADAQMAYAIGAGEREGIRRAADHVRQFDMRIIRIEDWQGCGAREALAASIEQIGR